MKYIIILTANVVDDENLKYYKIFQFNKIFNLKIMINYQSLIDELLPKKEALQNELREINKKIRQYKKTITLYEWRKKKSNK
jgi:hypothetical protein